MVRKSFETYEELHTSVYSSLVRFLEEKEYLRLLPWDASISLGALKGYIEKAGTGTADIITKCVNHGLRKPEFHQGADFKVIIWRKEVDQKSEQVAQKSDEVSQKIEQLSQKAQMLSQKLSMETIESIFYAVNNDAYVSVKAIAELCPGAAQATSP